MKTITVATSVILLASFCCWKRSQGGRRTINCCRCWSEHDEWFS